MMRIKFWLGFGLSVLAMVAGARGQDLVVEDVTPPQWQWGNQQVEVTVRNNTDWVKFLTINIEVEFIGSKYECMRRSAFHGWLEPSAQAVIKPRVYIPGNYGEAVVRMAFHDVIDTLDDILPGQEFFARTFEITIPRPAGMAARKDERITLPPRIEEHPFFDNEFSRTLFHFVREGITNEEISELTGAPIPYIEEQLRTFLGTQFITEQEGRHYLTFPLILADEASAAAALADSVALTLSETIKTNLAHYRPTLDSLIAAGAVSADSTSVFEKTSYLHYPYVVVAGMLLWYDLGHKFISQGMPFLMYRKMDICNALNARYMYATAEGDEYTGEHFYIFLSDDKTFRIIFADHVPEVDCGSDFLIGNKLKKQPTWRFRPDNQPDFFVIDSAAARPLLDVLSAGTAEPMLGGLSQLERLSGNFGQGRLTGGYRYWFWNMVASRVLNRLLEENVLQTYKRRHFMLGAAREN